jgi:hypothetical protein
MARYSDFRQKMDIGISSIERMIACAIELIISVLTNVLPGIIEEAIDTT